MGEYIFGGQLLSQTLHQGLFFGAWGFSIRLEGVECSVLGLDASFQPEWVTIKLALGSWSRAGPVRPTILRAQLRTAALWLLNLTAPLKTQRLLEHGFCWKRVGTEARRGSIPNHPDTDLRGFMAFRIHGLKCNYREKI